MSEPADDGMTPAPVPTRDRILSAFSRYPSAVLLLVVFGVELGVGMFVIRDVRTVSAETQRMYARSVLGLRQIGELQYQAQETRRSTLYALTTNNSNLQVEYADQSREADRRVTEGINAYLQQARMANEIELGRRLQRDWSAYLKIRDEVLASILEGSTKEAVDMDLSGGVPSFERVRQDLEEIKRLYDAQASEELDRVSTSSRRSIVRLVGVVCFTLIFATFSVWAIQKSRMLGAVQLAKLQMDFVASISHELRTPLAVIRSAADQSMDVAKIEALYRIVREERRELDRIELKARINRVQGRLRQVTKVGHNDQTRSRYVLYEDLDEMVAAGATTSRGRAERR